ncbi:MAG: hypothetical protein JRJ03_01285 [Deltaproteobacteria bacterium]|nr:hypothetical protein [Deltaproteobacteria bacterium]
MNSMDIEELIAKGESEINVEGISIPAHILKKLKEDGYSHLKVYRDNRTITVWGKNCSACFTEEQVHDEMES